MEQGGWLHWLTSVLPMSLAFAAGLRLLWAEVRPLAAAARRALVASSAWGLGAAAAHPRRRWRMRLALLYGAGVGASVAWGALLLSTGSAAARAAFLSVLR